MGNGESCIRYFSVAVIKCQNHLREEKGLLWLVVLGEIESTKEDKVWWRNQEAGCSYFHPCTGSRENRK